MLQQTTVTAVKPYFQTFVARWPTVEDLAKADLNDVLGAWAGLGYYRRARNLKAAAELIANAGGRFPDSADLLEELPGVGTYTAAAIAAIAFDHPEPVVDGNVERVIARLLAIQEALPAAKAAIRIAQINLTPAERPGDYAQAMMDLGAAICTPRQPACSRCPLEDCCRGALMGDPDRLPLRPPRPNRPTRFGRCYVAIRDDGAVLLRRRSQSGLLPGMTEVPGSGWTDAMPGGEEGSPLSLAWRPAPARVRHIFTHFRLELEVFSAAASSGTPAPKECWWSPSGKLAGEALPRVMKKAIEAAIPGSRAKP